MAKSKEPGNRSIETYLNEWLSLGVDSKRRPWKPKTKESYEGIARVHLIPRLGQIKLNKLNELDIDKAWKDMRADGHNESIIEHCHLRLATALSAVVRRKFISGNPIIFVPKPIAVPREMRAIVQCGHL